LQLVQFGVVNGLGRVLAEFLSDLVLKLLKAILFLGWEIDR